MNLSLTFTCRIAPVAILLILGGCASSKNHPTPASSEAAMVSQQPALPAGSKEIPESVRKEIHIRLEKYSSQIDGLERREMAADKIIDPEKRLADYEELGDMYGECREGVGEILDAPEYKIYREDPEYGLFWKAYAIRLNYWQAKMNVMRKKRDAAFKEVQAIRTKK